MFNRCALIALLSLSLWIPAVYPPSAYAQQTLGGITGTVTDKTGSVLPETTVMIVGDQTKLTRSQKTNPAGIYDFVNLPIGTYTLTFAHDGFQSEKIPSITVQADRTATLNTALSVGKVGTVVEVEAVPLLNAVDTTNGYVLEKVQIEAIPLPTGSFTGLAILSPGVNSELAAGTGANSGLGNQPIWANGQSGCQQFVQREKHEPGGLGANCEQHRGGGSLQYHCGNYSEHGVAVSGYRTSFADAGSGDDPGVSRKHLDV
jgi:hypothetical protein